MKRYLPKLGSQKKQKLSEYLEKEAKTCRNLTGLWYWVTTVIGVMMVLFYFFSAGLRPVGPQFHRGIYVLVTFVLIFLLYPVRGSSARSPQPTLLDLVFVIAAAGTCLYWIIEFPNLNQRMGAESDIDYYVGVIGLIVSLEAARRILGWSMTLIGIFMLLYAYFGRYMPGLIQHGGFSIKEIAVELFISTNGVFGVMANVLATYVILFIFFGAFLHKSGAGQFFLDLPMSLAGRSEGGPAKVAVLASALFGSISGSAIANTVSTGTFTIPLMKKAGFKPHVAGAIEPAASIGGMFLPPIMGAGGFIMAELLETSYSYIMAVAIFPALIYFFSVFVMIHFEAKKYHLHGEGELVIPKPMEVIKQGWYKSLPLVIITVLMIIGKSPGYAAFWATLSCIAVSYGSKETRMGYKEIWDAMASGARQTLVIGATVGVIGIIVGTIELTGIGLQFSNLIISVSENFQGTIIPQVLIAVILIALASLILGMGVPVTAAYLITVVLVAPSLTGMGVSLIAAHMIVYWFSQDSNITPPVCVAAYAGAAIAGADPWKTGWTSFKYAKMLYVMPVMFAFVPAVLLNDTLAQIIIVFVSCIFGTITFAALTQGYLFRRTNIYEWIFLIPITILLFWPTVTSTAIGLTLTLGLVFWQSRRAAIKLERK
ncbi:MAG: TRAP transporter permease [Deltaproteobacteria bacterium]|nr:TRAP transporter permease [Deltaproteobacteria bacterium]